MICGDRAGSDGGVRNAVALRGTHSNNGAWPARGVGPDLGAAQCVGAIATRTQSNRVARARPSTTCSRIWSGLTAFVENPEVPLGNDRTERGLRGMVLGRKNHYGSRSERGTQVAAMLYTLVETARIMRSQVGLRATDPKPRPW